MVCMSLDAIAKPAHGLDAIGFGRGGSQFRAQTFDGAIDGARIADIIVAPGLFQQTLTRQDTPGVDQQTMKQVEFETSLLDGGISDRNDAALHIHAEIPCAGNDRRRFRVFVFCAA